MKRPTKIRAKRNRVIEKNLGMFSHSGSAENFSKVIVR
ncbi:hypothetical protein Porky_127 [Mycobacterium phage Porky]|uniref:Uncharacterized protein n=4 Tax=Caudoviricetes TaxID=2731619 RepID=B5A687_9CAUD|nr:hypothetical protein Porky_127 [Mycobacterium phage Porky]YP_008857615.1 hypothetical protein PHATBACTER_130 [Mycobacterium phage PhatBacter]YP_008858407.1 hypothetical protein NALA_129 [Mycobacterium phage Nala]YP_008858856.1 hypothetical protein HUFFLYPUFF_129 [Mycobacterium phage HufflyPuff]YP_008859559.1 hypothetical protein BRUIN_124 [Mycobacterium phage Bruin]YP_009197790.1 hypothetical protein SEA_NELITZAMV_124 [Mycobacterium phage NelitzaMV]YP_009224393.1 hypothetical protein SEA_D